MATEMILLEKSWPLIGTQSSRNRDDRAAESCTQFSRKMFDNLAQSNRLIHHLARRRDMLDSRFRKQTRFGERFG